MYRLYLFPLIHIKAANDVGSQIFPPIQSWYLFVVAEPERDFGSSAGVKADTFSCSTATKGPGERKRIALPSAAEIRKSVM